VKKTRRESCRELLHDRLAAVGGAADRGSFGKRAPGGGEAAAVKLLADGAEGLEAVGITPQRHRRLRRDVGHDAQKLRAGPDRLHRRLPEVFLHRPDNPLARADQQQSFSLSIPLYVARTPAAGAAAGEGSEPESLAAAWAKWKADGEPFWRQMDEVTAMLDGLAEGDTESTT